MFFFKERWSQRLRHHPFTVESQVRILYVLRTGRLAQLAGASALQAEGQRFESAISHESHLCG